jgi:hypothetical protein
MKPKKHLSAEQNLLRFMFLQFTTMAAPMGEFATWLLTGTAAILGAILVNVEAVSKVLSPFNLRWGLIFLVISMVFGVIVRQLGIALNASLQLDEHINSALDSAEGESIINSITEPLIIKSELPSPFLPPFRGMIKRSLEKGGQDLLGGEKWWIKLLCIQVYMFWAQGLTGAIGLIMLGAGITA